MLLMKVQCGCQFLASSRMQLATRMPIGVASNRRRVSNRVCLLLVPQWPQSAIKSVIHYVKDCLNFLYNGRCATLSVSPISAIVALADIQISDVCRDASRINL
jgi:hypothetical protein